MADVRHRTTWGSRLRFAVRFLGLTGLLAAAVGAVLGSTVFGWPDSWPAAEAAGRAVWSAATDDAAGTFARAASIVLLAGLVVVVLALLVELLGLLVHAATRRTAAGTSATLATAAAVALLVFANAYSFTHYRRYDCTRDGKFTLPAAVADDLRKLRPDSPTTIVVLQMHKTFGTRSDKRDSYVSAAEYKVAEKVRDLIDQFREFGPRFNVAVLDTEAFEYDRQLADLTASAPELKAAIDAAPENCILFHANKRVQRLEFGEFLQLDKTGSKAADGDRGNLVLLPQGVESFARRVVAVQERRPKVALCVVHGYLTTEGTDPYTMAGFRKTLTNYGFDVVDVVLRKNWNSNDRELEPAAHTQAESELEKLEAELGNAEARVQEARAEVTVLGDLKTAFDKSADRPVGSRVQVYQGLSEAARNNSWLEMTAVYTKWVRMLGEDTEKEFRAELGAALVAQRKRAEQQAAEVEKEKREADDRLKEAMKDERSLQNRRVTDVRTRFSALLSDVDLLVVPRYTIQSVSSGAEVPPELHAMSPEQVDVVRDYMKTGRPVLALLGPTVTTRGPSTNPDGFEKLLAERGVELGRDAVIFDAEARQLAARLTGNQFGSMGTVEPPPLAVEDRAEDGVTAKPNPVGEAVRVTGRSIDQTLDIRLASPRPVYVAAGWQAKLPFAAEFVLTGPDSWNEVKPFPTGDQFGRVTYIPRFEAGGTDDRTKRTRAEERRGPFPVAVAVEGKPPVEWYEDEYGRGRTEAVGAVCGMALARPVVAAEYARLKTEAAAALPFDGGLTAACVTADAARVERPAGRLVVFGSGGLFTGEELKPAQDKLLLHSVNWLTNRADRLPTAPDVPWSFPRVAMDDRELTLWRWGTAVLMPLAAVYFGVIAVMVRRTR